MAFGEPQTPPNQDAVNRAKAHSKGLLTMTTTVIDTGERKQMFGFTARHLKTVTVWEASPKKCQSPHVSAETDGWYVDLLYGIDCSPDLSGSETLPWLLLNGKCFTEYGIKRRYWVERKRIGPASLGFPLLETRKAYDDKGQAEVTKEEVLELSTAELDASLFDVPPGFVSTEPRNSERSFFDRVFSFISRR